MFNLRIKKSIVGVLLIILLFVVVSSVAFGAKLTLKVAHCTNTDHPYQLGLLKFKEIVESKTNGEIEVNIFPSGQLGNERDYVEAIQLGTLDMALACTAPLEGFVEKFMVFDLPFLFKSKQHAYEALDGTIGKDVLTSLESKKVICCFLYASFTSKAPQQTIVLKS